MHGWMMGDWGAWGPGHGILGMVIMLLFWVLIIVGIVLVVRWLLNQGGQKPPQTDASALEILEKRYAQGEIDKEKFDAMKQDLT